MHHSNSKQNLKPTDWAHAVALACHALVGNITTNFRRVSIVFEDNTWLLKIITFQPIDEKEQEYIRDEIASDFANAFVDWEHKISNTSYSAGHKHQIVSSSEPTIPPCANNERIVFSWRSQ